MVLFSFFSFFYFFPLLLFSKTTLKVTFLITDSEIKEERFLLFFNSILMTGDIGGLFAKEEIMGMCADLLPKFEIDRPNLRPTPDNLRQFFIDTVRDNLHLVLCMSPANPLFPVRAQRFPGIINGVTIDWFLAWPQEALVEVSSTFLDDFKIECTEEVKNAVKIHMGTGMFRRDLFHLETLFFFFLFFDVMSRCFYFF